AEPETLVLGPQIEFVDFTVVEQAACTIASVIGVARHALTKLQDGDAATLADRGVPPVRPATVDQFVEFVARDDSLVGGTPRLVVRLGDFGRVRRLRAANLYEGRGHSAIEATKFPAFKPYR